MSTDAQYQNKTELLNDPNLSQLNNSITSSIHPIAQILPEQNVANWYQDNKSPLLVNPLFWFAVLVSSCCIPFGGDSSHSAVMKLVMTAVIVGCILLVELALKRFSDRKEVYTAYKNEVCKAYKIKERPYYSGPLCLDKI